jgi:hemoglobin
MTNNRKHILNMAALVIFALPISAGAATSYYDQFGGHQGITTLVSTFIGNVAADPRINYYFAHTNIPYLEASLVKQIGQVEGGPEVYNGPDMVAVHKKLGVTEAAFNALAEDLIRAMDTNKIPIAAQNDLLAKFAGLESEVVTK